MSLANCQAILGLGGFFILLGIAFILWNKREEGKYYNSISTQKDVKEFITHEPERSWLHAWQIGGKICLVIGIILVVAGGVLWLIFY
ncbi:MAG TPA: hypothetical protein VMY79_02675 [Dehalococcoidia bacterium]|nr:hypothetical protein [Dehalococcoidia bacterium]